MKTYSAKPTEVARRWYVLDASQVPLGRLSTKAATLLTGKGKPMFTQHIDCGDYVIVINASVVVTTGNKLEAKNYYHYSGYPSGLKSRTLKEQLIVSPEHVITHAVRGMLPANKLRPSRLLRLKVYPDSVHGHEAQQPEVLNLSTKKKTSKEGKA